MTNLANTSCGVMKWRSQATLFKHRLTLAERGPATSRRFPPSPHLASIQQGLSLSPYGQPRARLCSWGLAVVPVGELSSRPWQMGQGQGDSFLWGRENSCSNSSSSGRTITHFACLHRVHGALHTSLHAMHKQPWMKALLAPQGQNEETESQRKEVIFPRPWSSEWQS